MPLCKNCHREISRFDSDVCPYCGEPHPIEDDYKTKDMTKFLDPVKEEEGLYRSKRKLAYVLLTFFLGPFGAGEFYIGKMKSGLAYLILTFLFLALFGTAFYFLVPGIGAYWFLIGYALPFALGAGKAVSLVTKDDLKDGNGEFLR